MKYTLTTIWLVLSGAMAYSQAGECERMYKAAINLSNDGKYALALNKLAAAKICNPGEAKYDREIIKIYEEINSQKDSAVAAKKQAESALAREKIAKQLEAAAKNDAVKQKEIVQDQLARTFWSSSRNAVATNNYLNALHFTAEGVGIVKPSDLSKNMLTDVQSILPAISLKNIFPQNDYVSSGTFTPDGTQLIIEGGYTVRISDAETGKLLHDLPHERAVLKAVLSPDGKQLVTTTYAYIDYYPAQLWDVSTGKKIGITMKHSQQVVDVLFSPDQKYILTVGEDSTLRFWDTKTYTILIPELKYNGYIGKVAFSPDSKLLLIAGNDSSIRVLDIQTGKYIGATIHDEGQIKNAVFSPDQQYILSTSRDSSAQLWLTTTGQPVTPEMMHQASVVSGCFTPDGKHILTAARDQTLSLWNVPAGSLAATFTTDQVAISEALFTPDGKTILVIAEDSTIALWNAATLKRIGKTVKFKGHIITAFFSPDSKQIVTISTDNSRSARSWNIDLSGSQNVIINDNDPVIQSAFSFNGELVLTLSKGKVHVYNSMGKEGNTGIAGQQTITDIVTSPVSDNFLTVYTDSTLKIWQSTNGRYNPVSIGYDGVINSVAFSHDGKYIITAGQDSTARIWNSTNGKPAAPVMVHEAEVLSAAFSLDGKSILTRSLSRASRRQTEFVQVWKMGREKPAVSLKLDGTVPSAVFSSDSRYFLTTSNREPASVRDAASGKIIVSTKDYGPVDNAIFSPDGNLFLTADHDGIIRLWGTKTGKPLGLSMNVEGGVNKFEFSPDGKWILTAGKGGLARVWETGTGIPIGQPMVHKGAVTNGEFSADGKRILTSGMDGVSYVWKVEGDMDIPATLFKLQTMVSTGCRLNLNTNYTELIPIEEWHKLNVEYKTKAKEHYKVCRYRQYNSWSHFNVDEAKKL